MNDLIVHIVLLSIFSSFYILDDKFISGGAANRWNYQGSLNPFRWYLEYPHCAGRQQSPINIDTSKVTFNNCLTPLQFYGYDNVRNVRTSLENNGHTVEVDLAGRPITVSGGGLPDTYRVKQFHFHWGDADNRGSEHAINGYHYPMEMHIVHYSTRYESYEEAESMPYGLAVLAFFFRVGRHNHHFDEIINHLSDIQFRGDHISLHSFPLASLLPRNTRHYYRYQGSLTTPPCYESVIWTIFKTPDDISESQLNQFRYLVNANFQNETNHRLYDDFRPIQPLYGRHICSSDPLDLDLSSIFPFYL